jgi:hypothetical protein
MIIKGIQTVGLMVDGDDARQGAPSREHKSNEYVKSLVLGRLAASNASPDVLAHGNFIWVFLQKYCAYFNRFSLWRKLRNVFPQHAPGNSLVWERLAATIDMRLDCDIRRIDVGGDKIIVRTDDGEALQFDRLTWACDPKVYKKCLAICPESAEDWRMQEYVSRVRTIFSKVRKYYRAVIHVKIGSRLPKPIFWFLCDEFRCWYFPSMVVSAGDSKFYNFYSWIRKPLMSDEEAEAMTVKLQQNIEKTTESMGFHVDKFCGVYYWDWLPHFSPEDIQDGIFGRLEQIQGQPGVYFTGELLAVPGVTHVVEYSQKLVSRHFAPRPAVTPVPPRPGLHADITRILDGKLDYNAYSRKDVDVDVDRLYLAPPSNPEWAAVATWGVRYVLSLLQMVVSLLLTTIVLFLKLVLLTGGLRVTHRLGVGCRATFRITRNPRLAFSHSAFLSKLASYKSCIRFAQSSYHDNSALDVKLLSLKVLENEADERTGNGASLIADHSMFDLVMQTCPASVICSLRFWMLQILPVRGHARRHNEAPGVVEALRSRVMARIPPPNVKKPYVRGKYGLAKSRFHLEEDQGKTWVVTF